MAHCLALDCWRGGGDWFPGGFGGVRIVALASCATVQTTHHHQTVSQWKHAPDLPTHTHTNAYDLYLFNAQIHTAPNKNRNPVHTAPAHTYTHTRTSGVINSASSGCCYVCCDMITYLNAVHVCVRCRFWDPLNFGIIFFYLSDFCRPTAV